MALRLKKAPLFIVLTIFLSWLYLDAFLLLGAKWNTLAATAVAVGYMFIPLVCAIIVQKVICKGPLRQELGIVALKGGATSSWGSWDSRGSLSSCS